MNYDIFIWEIVNFISVCIISSIIYLYFEYQDSNKLYRLFVPKNDSIWERIKVLLAPTLLFILIEMLLLSNISPNFMFAKLISIIAMVITNPLIFIIFFKFSKQDMLVINVFTTICSAAIGLLISLLILNIPTLPLPIVYISMVGIIMIIAFYLIATFFQTEDFIFLDPVTKKINLKKEHQ